MNVTWSFSSLKQFMNCPRQYNEVKNLQTYPVKVTSQMQYGTDVHKALENYAREGTELPEFYRQYKPMVDTLLEIPGDVLLEHKMALTQDKTPCDFDAEHRWVRGIVDFMVVSGQMAYIVDYKTGSDKYPDPKQLKLMSLLTFAHFPEVTMVKAGLLFVTKNNFLPYDYHKDKQDSYWADFQPDLQRLTLSYERDFWPANPSPLCRWCPVESCQFNGD